MSAALDREKERRGVSLNQTVIDLLTLSLGITRPRNNGLGRFAGTWSDAEHQEFLRAVRQFEEIDADLWK